MQKKKGLALVLSFALVACLAVAGTLAWLTSTTGEVKNTFTVGNVAITLDEAVTDEYGVKQGEQRGMGNTYKLINGHTYVKDPTVHVQEGEDCWLFVKVEDGMAAFETEGNKVVDQMTANGNWTLVAGETNVYAYKQIVNAGDDIKVFTELEIAGDVDLSTVPKGANITIMAYAVQADGFDTAAEAWEEAPGAWTANN